MKNSKVILAVIILLSLCCSVLAASPTPYLDLVKKGLLKIDRGITIEQAFDNYGYFKKTEWEFFETRNKRKIVQFNGHIDLVEYKKQKNVDSQEIKVIIQFSINSDDTFNIFYIGYDIKSSDGKKYATNFNVNGVIKVVSQIYKNAPVDCIYEVLYYGIGTIK